MCLYLLMAMVVHDGCVSLLLPSSQNLLPYLLMDRFLATGCCVGTCTGDHDGVNC